MVDLLHEYEDVCELFRALASPVRAGIVHRLSGEESSVGSLAEAMGISQPLVSQHLRVLRGAGLVKAERHGQEVRYSLADEHVAHIFIDAYQHTQESRHE